jgi:hypothetical protein
MSGHSINTAATLQCPHGGSVSISSSNQSAKADSASIATQADTYTVSGCAFMKGTVPSPCMLVVWIVADSKVTAGNIPSLSKSATGLCMSATGPQGSVMVSNTQSKAESK